MRRFADTLPTLRDNSGSEAPPLAEVARFDPPFLARTMASGLPDTTFMPNGAGIKALLRRREDHDAVATAPAPATTSGRPGRLPSAIPSLDIQRDRTDALVAAAVAEVRREAEKARAAAVELARKVERDVAARTIADARAAWCNDEALHLSTRFDAAFEALHVRLSNAMAQALSPIALQAIREQAILRFAATLDDLVGRNAGTPAIVVEGPADLLASLRHAMGTAGGVSFRETDHTEIVAEVGDTRLETTIGAWAENLARSLGQGLDHG